eukprot:gnl/TRDRNA2_/TRDRNA2_162256_c0_seq1.p1 gnl/TRDRNA2_/TRDRNA2_162256_c0~~gnl/TRDRNA2_/TRDRNA2_162256_c0_seq1.p1  ORF type:complete len:154 (+),score=30.04 gnl/TRDRNA2_/TRDRNA2_162256_c0_seq1:278-739(+)
MYNERFAVTEGRLTAAVIDETYCLSDVMPGCQIHLSTKTPEEKYALESQGEIVPYMFESPAGTFHGLEVDNEYFAYVEEDQAEFLKSQKHAREMFADMSGKSGERDQRHDSYTAAFREVLVTAKQEGQRRGLEGEKLSAFVEARVAEFNRGQS